MQKGSVETNFKKFMINILQIQIVESELDNRNLSGSSAEK